MSSLPFPLPSANDPKASVRDAPTTNFKGRLALQGQPACLAHPFGKRPRTTDETRPQPGGSFPLGCEMNMFIEILISGKRILRPCFLLQQVFEIRPTVVPTAGPAQPPRCEPSRLIRLSARKRKASRSLARTKCLRACSKSPVFSSDRARQKWTSAKRSSMLTACWSSAMAGPLSLGGQFLPGPAKGVTLLLLCRIEVLR